jgi:Flp pilus assembly protein TadD
MSCRTALIIATAAALGLAACARGPRPDVIGAQRSLAQELIHKRDYQRAFAVADALCRSAPRKPDGYLLRGIVYREQRLLEEARGDLEEAVRLAPKSARAHSALAILHDAMASTEAALEHHRRAVELEPNDAQYLNNLGFSLFAHGKAREAVETLQRAVRAAPADPRIRNNLGFSLAATGDLTRAAEQFAFGGTAADAKTNLGWAYERRGSLVQAFELYLEALRLDPGATSARKNLTRVARDLGRPLPAEVSTPPGA